MASMSHTPHPSIVSEATSITGWNLLRPLVPPGTSITTETVRVLSPTAYHVRLYLSDGREITTLAAHLLRTVVDATTRGIPVTIPAPNGASAAQRAPGAYLVDDVSRHLYHSPRHLTSTQRTYGNRP